MTPFWLVTTAVIALISLVAALLHSSVEREIVNDGEDELAHRVRWKLK